MSILLISGTGFIGQHICDTPLLKNQKLRVMPGLRRFYGVLILLAGVALAVPCFAVDYRDDLQLVGEGKLRVLFWNVYQSRLYTSDGRYSPQTIPVKFEVQYLRDFKAKALVEQTRDEWLDLGFEKEDIEPWLDDLIKIWPDISKNDELSG